LFCASSPPQSTISPAADLLAVIASEAKQSSLRNCFHHELDCFVASLLAMTERMSGYGFVASLLAMTEPML
jgi:hypothetical protein